MASPESSATGDVEKYLRGVLDPGVSAAQVVDCMAAGREVVHFEDLKRYMLEGGGASAQAPRRASTSSLLSNAQAWENLPPDNTVWQQSNSKPLGVLCNSKKF